MNRRTFIHGAALTWLATELSSAYADVPTPRSPFGAHSTAEEVTAGLNLSGMTTVVTGCNSGIGYETMRVLALRGAHVIGSARTLEKGRKACKSVKGRTTPVVLELTDFGSIVECADAVQAMKVSIDMLILNAGIVLGELQQVNGIEKQFVVNHLGHFILANRLMDRVQAARQGRVVVVGSGNHRNAPEGGIQFDNLSGKGWSSLGYAHSKLANGLFSLELAKRLQGTRATSNCVTPGGAADAPLAWGRCEDGRIEETPHPRFARPLPQGRGEVDREPHPHCARPLPQGEVKKRPLPQGEAKRVASRRNGVSA